MKKFKIILNLRHTKKRIKSVIKISIYYTFNAILIEWKEREKESSGMEVVAEKERARNVHLVTQHFTLHYITVHFTHKRALCRLCWAIQKN